MPKNEYLLFGMAVLEEFLDKYPVTPFEDLEEVRKDLTAIKYAPKEKNKNEDENGKRDL